MSRPCEGVSAVLSSLLDLPPPKYQSPPTPNSPTATPPPPTSTPAPAIVAAVILDFELFSLSVAVGTTIVWENVGAAPHTTTSDASPDPSARWDSGVLNNGQTFQFTFDRTGEFDYLCTKHPFMTATITVTEAPRLRSVAASRWPEWRWRLRMVGA